MPREFYTEKDIEDLFKGGVRSLQVKDDVVLTELAYEKAKAIGMKLLHDSPDQPPSAPVRPYISKMKGPYSGVADAAPVMPQPPLHNEVTAKKGAPVALDLPQRIHEAVVARIGGKVDANLLDVIIKRVLAGTGVK